MLFNSIEFLFFLPIAFSLYWFVFNGRRMQNLLVVIASYVFYGWWDWRFLLLIAITSFCSYLSGLLLSLFDSKKRIRLSINVSNIVLNLGILAVFKYFNFFADNLIVLFDGLGYHLDIITIDVILPVGISFYTFQALSYSIDVYRKKIEPTYDIIDFFAFISFFPQLVAGPIERAINLLPQFQKDRYFDYSKAIDGLRQMLWGFFKKLVIADNCAFIVNLYWNQYENYNGVTLLALGLLFTFQIYCDFSGYSDIAIGCARLFGINLVRNFEFPYFSKSIPEFWRKWHMSLMTWFRDYIYFPLGGSRCAQWKIVRNTFFVFLISGLWHGANWTFIIWGMFHACLISLYILLHINTKPTNVSKKHLLPSVKDIIQMFITFFLVILGWIIFRADSLHQAWSFINRMFSTLFDDYHIVFERRYILYGLILLGVEWLQRDKQHALQISNIKFFKHKITRWSVYVVLIITILGAMGQPQSFIYFQF